MDQIWNEGIFAVSYIGITFPLYSIYPKWWLPQNGMYTIMTQVKWKVENLNFMWFIIQLRLNEKQILPTIFLYSTSHIAIQIRYYLDVQIIYHCAS